VHGVADILLVETPENHRRICIVAINENDEIMSANYLVRKVIVKIEFVRFIAIS